MYLYTAMADLAFETGDPALKRTLETLWKDVMDTKMYITAGLGPSAHNEGFTHDFDLPNQTAYAETCASVALIFWAQRMLHLELDGRYADILETALYNGALSGLGRDGTHYFYANPLESNGSAERWEWHTCPCCTMNVSRLVASVGGYFVSTAPDGVAFHLYGGMSTSVAVGGTKVQLRETSNYPWAGKIAIAIDPEAPTAFDVKLRIPGWCSGWSLKVNGETITLKPENGYVTVHRTWSKGDRIALELPMPPERVYANPAVIMDAGRVALKRGPLVYCVEEADNGEGLNGITLSADISQAKTSEIAGLRGAVALDLPVSRDASDWGADLYRTSPPVTKPATARFVPYPFWDNREPGEMLVWVRAGEAHGE